MTPIIEQKKKMS